MDTAYRDYLVYFTSILYEALPFVVLGSVIAGFVEEFVPQQFLGKFFPKQRFLGILAGGLLGLIFPMCECGIIVVMRRLLRKGLPLSCCIAYILAGPILNVVVLSNTYIAFANFSPAEMGGAWMVFFRAFWGYVVAVVTALVVEQVHQRYGNSLLTPLATPPPVPAVDENESAPASRQPVLQRFGNIAETSLHDFVDITVFLILGALIASFIRVNVTENQIAEFSASYPALSIAVMMVFAVLICLCSEADAFVAASLRAMQPAAKVAFLVLGPMLDLKLYIMYTRVFRPRLIWTIITCVVVQVFIYSLITHFLWQAFGPAPELPVSGR